MINHFRRYNLLYFGYVLPVFLNVGIFRMFANPDVAPGMIAFIALCPGINWAFLVVFALFEALDAIGRLILP